MTAQDVIQQPGKYRLTVDDYITLDAAGAFKGLRTELVGGEIIVVSPQYRPHMRVKDELAFALRLALRAAGNSLYVGTEGSVALSPHDFPQPDIVLTREPEGEGAIPGTSIVLVIEVADTSLGFDLGDKAAAYAEAKVPEYWVADVRGRSIRQFWSPSGGTYRSERLFAFGTAVDLQVVPGLIVPTDTL